MQIMSFICLSPMRSSRPLADWCTRAAAGGNMQPQRCRDTWAVGVPNISSPWKLFPHEIYASSRGLLMAPIYACLSCIGNWLTTKADFHCSSHFAILLTGVKPDHIGCPQYLAHGGVKLPGILFMTWRAQGVMSGWLLVFLFTMCCHKASWAVVWLVAFQGVRRKPCMLLPIGGNLWPCLNRVNFSHFFTLWLCRRDLRVLVCFVTGYNILNW